MLATLIFLFSLLPLKFFAVETIWGYPLSPASLHRRCQIRQPLEYVLGEGVFFLGNWGEGARCGRSEGVENQAGGWGELMAKVFGAPVLVVQ
jgi:hypothetical protein